MKPRPRKWLVCLAALGALVCVSAWLLVPFPAEKLQLYPAGTVVLDCNGNVLRVTLGTNDVQCQPIHSEQTGPWIGKAVVAVEDRRFYQHSGVDLLAIGRAAWQNLAARRVVSGASTISEQVVRLIEPRPRHLWAKLFEACRAWQMERRLSKAQILEQYLNRAPFGSNLVGMEAASQRYFGKSAADLSLPEAALLAGLPQSPTRLRPDLRPERALKRRDHVLRRMWACGYISRQQLDVACTEPVRCVLHPPAFRAPHFCDLVLARNPLEHTLRTTLDGRLQQIAEDVIAQYAARLSAQGIHGGAIVVLDVRHGAVRAMVGSPDFWDKRHAGEVNGAVARRSPGSALKPFVYALAMDRGLCTPATVMADVPMTRPGFEPQNFDREFSGMVSVREALVRSLNIPALQITQEVGQEDFVRLLRRAGLTTLDKPASHYGLGIVLGSGEVKLLDLANAYACLARGGVYRPARLLETDPPAEPVRLFSAEATYMMADILSGDERAVDLCGHAADVNAPRLAWKTGTSAGYRDAWTIAYNPDYVVGVWLGNPDGRPAAALVGREVASPLAGEIFRRLYPNGAATWFKCPAVVRTRMVCARSGQPPNKWCDSVVADLYIPGVSSTTPCPVHRELCTGRSRCGAHSCEVWPTEVESYVRTHGAPRTGAEHAGGTLRISSPISGGTFCRLTGFQQVKQEIALSALTDAGSEALFWFVDGELFGTSQRDGPVFWPLRLGRHLINCADNLGRSDAVTILVE